MEPWRRNLYVLVLAVAVTHFGFDFSQPFFPLYVRFLGVTDLGEAALWSGLIIGITPLITGLLAPIWGAVADRYGRKKLVIRALLSISFLATAVAVAPNVWWAFGARLAMGLVGGFTPAAMALAIGSVPRERVGQAVGMMQAAQFLPLALGPLIGGPLADTVGLRWNFFLTAMVAVVGTLVLAVLFTEPPAGPSASPAQTGLGSGWLALLVAPAFATAAAALMMAQFADRSLPPILPLFLASLAPPAGALGTITGLVISAGAVAAAVSSWAYGRYARPERAPFVLIAALAGSAVCFGLLALTDSWELVLAARVLLGLVGGGAPTLIYTMATRAAPADRTGLAVGLLALCSNLGNGLAPILAGSLALLDLRAVFLVDAMLLLVALSVVARLRRAARTGSGPERSAA